MLDVSIVSGPVRLALLLAGPLALLGLLVPRTPSWWRRRVPIALTAGLAASGLVVLVVEVLWRPFPDPLPRPAVLFTGLTVAALVLAVGRRSGRIRAGLALTGVVLVGVTGAAQVNQQFQAFPTLRGVLGLPLAGQVAFNRLPTPGPLVVTAVPGQPLADTWRRPAGLGSTGVLTNFDIPGTRSGFRARPSWVYLPPAYQSTPRPLLPVLMLLAGQPGTPRDWFDGGKLREIMDGYAQTHAGLAPVVVVPDPLGSQFANPLCVDSTAGNAFTYLSQDVPDWIKGNLQVDRDHAHWAVGGVSAGATCALQLAVAEPATFPTALVLSGQVEPTLGDRARTVRLRFGGSTAAFRAANPLDVLATKRMTGSAAVVAVGAQDARYRPEADILADAMQKAGISVRRASAPGSHSWVVWRALLTGELDWLAARLGLISQQAAP